MAEYAVSVLLALAVSVFAAYPLFSARENGGGAMGGGDELSSLRERRDLCYSLIRDAELDRDTGKLNEEDYAELVSGYKREASSVMRRISELAPPGEEKDDA